MEKAYVDENYGRNLTLPADVPDAHTRALRALIRQKELALLLIAEADTGGDRQRLTGVSTLDRFSAGGIVVPADGAVWLVTGNALPDTEQDAGYRCVLHEEPYRYYRANGFCRQTMERLLSGGRRVGTVHGAYMRTSLHTFWTQTLGCELVDVTMDAERCGAAALPAEREAMRRASVQTARLFAAAQGILEPGLTLREARIELRRCAYRLGCFGADDGISSSLTLHIFPGGGPPETNGRETLEAGDCVGFRACCVWDDARYSMAARVFCLDSQFPAPMDALWAAACEAQRAAVRVIRPGACLQAAADAANAVLRARGCCADESRFLFAIGCARQERPCLLDASAQWPLSEGMILAIAPTAALLSGQQFCCADVFEVTADGCIPLAPLSREPVLLG